MDCTNKNCPAYAKCLAPYRGSRCAATRATYGLGDPKTNADCIRVMTDEELARYYAKRIVRCYGCEAVTEDDCYECQLGWLKSPAEVDNG